jgi:serine phosphatase RsbU (regulator of sigma subunit)
MTSVSQDPLAELAEAGRRIVAETSLEDALHTLAEAVASALAADVAVVRVADDEGMLSARSIVARSDALAAELVGSRFSPSELPREDTTNPDVVPEPVRAVAKRVRAESVLLVPVWAEDNPLGSLELIRAGTRFDNEELALARVAAGQLGLALVAFRGQNGAEAKEFFQERALGLAGDALAAGYDVGRIGDQIVRLATSATGAVAARLWRIGADGGPEPFVASDSLAGESPSKAASNAAARALREQESVSVARGEPMPEGGFAATMRLGQPAFAVLQLFLPQQPPSERLVRRLSSFAVRAAHALRAGERAGETVAELERTRALLAVVGQAMAQLSLSHALETAADRVAELMRTDRVAIYLEDDGRLQSAHERGLAGPHAAVAERLLELALGPVRTQGMLHVTDAGTDPRLAEVHGAVHEAGIEAALVVPLLVHEDLTGLLAVYLPRGHTPGENERMLLSALAVQLAVAVQNAKLHEDAKRNETEAKRARVAAEQAARRLDALHQISSSFAESLSLETTLDAVARAAVELLGVDAAVIRMEDPRGERLVPVASHVAQPRLDDALRPLLERPQEVERLPGRRLFSMGKALVLDPESAGRLGASYELLVPFLEQGSTAVVVPIALPAELLATLTVVSLDPARRIGPDAVETALSVAAQTALAIDNARLYQQQKDFLDTMQRSLLPQEWPQVPGVEIGAVYEPASRVEVGGDLYDFLPLADGRLAAVLGDVSGHGIAATAEMALAKFAFRSLAREHPEPSDFLAHANEVALGELSDGAFITMIYLIVDGTRDELALASAGHPPPRLVAPDGSVTTLEPRGLALGVEPRQTYTAVSAAFPPGYAICVFTDGIIEARSDDAQYGEARLEAALEAGRELSAQALAEHVVADCRAFAGGELADDCAVVVVRRE